MKQMKRWLYCVGLFFVIAGTGSFSASQSELKVLSRWVHWSDASKLLIHHLNDQAFDFLDQRKLLIDSIDTAEGWRERQQQVKNLYQNILGPFPVKTPLNAQVTGVIHKEDYRVEKIVFESMPDFYVTSCLFIPENIQGKAPAILNPIGHTGIAFRAPGYQHIIINLVKKGFIVFAYDPLGQGERLQYFDPQKDKSLVGGPTSEHSHFGWQCFLNGISSARYFTWDGMRAIDYLISRSEVDPDRIGVTGISGGGTQTAYISALDERVAVSAPTCYITNFRRLLQSIGPQDAEQNFYMEIAKGLDHPDFLEVRAPKPTMIVATTNDFFSIQGVRETYNEAKKAFAAFGLRNNLVKTEDDHGHGFTKKNNEAMFAFLQKQLHNPGDPTDNETKPLSQEELTVTDTGQVITALDSRIVYDVNKGHTQENIEKIELNRDDLERHIRTVKRTAKEISGYRLDQAQPEALFMGGLPQDGYRIEKYVIQSEGQCVVPLLVFAPDTEGPHPAVIYLHPEGKSKDAADGGFIEQLVGNGLVVAAADLSGLGEVGECVSGIKAPFTALLIGRSIPGIHAGEIVRIARFLQSHEKVEYGKIAAVAFSNLCPALMHAAAFDQSISQTALVKPLISYESVAMTRLYKTPGWINVAGALSAYDLSDLTACIAPRPLLMLQPNDAFYQPVEEDEAGEVYKVTQEAFEDSEAQLTIQTGDMSDSELQERLMKWLKKAVSSQN